MKLRAGKWQTEGEHILVAVQDWRGKITKRLLPRLGWEELEPGFWMLSLTAKWVRPLFLLRRKGELRAYEGREAVEKERKR